MPYNDHMVVGALRKSTVKVQCNMDTRKEIMSFGVHALYACLHRYDNLGMCWRA